MPGNRAVLLPYVISWYRETSIWPDGWAASLLFRRAHVLEPPQIFPTGRNAAVVVRLRLGTKHKDYL
jgi:hypothetical protein